MICCCILRGRLSHTCSGAAVVFGGDGDDRITTAAGADVIHGGNGIDTISAGAGIDQVFGDADDDVFNWKFGDGNDEVFTWAGVGYVDGGPGDDLLDGGSGDDRLRGFTPGGAEISSSWRAAGSDASPSSYEWADQINRRRRQDT